MRTRFSVATAGLAGLALATGLVLVGGAAANAAAPTYEPDPQAVGSLALYDSSGNHVTSGNINNPIAAFAVGSATVHAGDVKAALFGASPNPTATSSASSSWSTEQWTGFTAYPIAGPPANVAALSATNPTATIGSTDETLANFITDFPNDPAHDSNAAFQNLYQIRLVTATTGGVFATDHYDEMDVLVSGTTWTQVFPALPTTTVLTSSQNPAGQGASVTLTATVSISSGSIPAGGVVFSDGATALNTTPVPINTTTGVATLPTTFSTSGAHSLSAVFTPTDTTDFAGSTGTLTENVVPATSTAVASNSDGNAGDPFDLTATVTPIAGDAGTLAFTDNGTAIPGTVTQAANVFTLHLAAGLPAGTHVIVGSFTPTNQALFAPSSGTITLNEAGAACSQPGSQCGPDTQNISATIPVGTLILSTPYYTGVRNGVTGLGTLNVNLSLQGASTATPFLGGTAAFNGIQVIDTRSGNLPYTVSAVSSALSASPSNATSINPENVGLNGFAVGSSSGGFDPSAANLTFAGAAASSPPVLTADAGTAGLEATQEMFHANHGLGTVIVNGVLTINAPVNTLNGIYSGTITFTVGEQ